MMLVLVAILQQSSRQMFWKEPADHLHDLVAQIVRRDTEPLGEGVEASLEAEPCRQPVRAEIANRQEGVLPVPFRDIEGDAMEVLAFDRQIFEIGKNVPAN